MTAVAKVIKTIVATGASSGLGYEAIKLLLTAAPPDTVYRVYIGARNIEAATRNYDVVQWRNRHHIFFLDLDLSDLTRVRNFAIDVLDVTKDRQIDTLLLCAGIVKGVERSKQRDPYCETMLVNYISQQYLVQLLRNKLSLHPSRIVFVSSRKYRDASEPDTFSDIVKGPTTARPFDLYNVSKFIQLLSVLEWRSTLPPDVETIAVSPGFVPATRLGREFGVLGRLSSSLMRFAPFATSLTDGAQAIAVAMTEKYTLNSVSRLLLDKTGVFEDLDHRLLDGDLQKKWSFSQNRIEEMYHL